MWDTIVLSLFRTIAAGLVAFLIALAVRGGNSPQSAERAVNHGLQQGIQEGGKDILEGIFSHIRPRF